MKATTFMKKTIFFAFAMLLLFANATVFAKQINLQVDGVTCPFCVASSKKQLKKIDGVTSVDSDLENGLIKVCAADDTSLDDDMLKQLFLDQGFVYRGQESVADCEA